MKNKMIYALVLALITSGVMFAQENEVLTLTVDDAVEYAAKNSRTLKTAELDFELAKWKKNFAWNVFLPTAQVSGTSSRSNDYTNTVGEIMKAIMPGYSPAPTTESNHWTAVGNLSVSLGLNAALVQSMRATYSDFEAGKITWEQTQKETEVNIRKYFYALLLQQENVNLQKTTLENARQRQEQAQVNFRNGYVPELSLLKAQVDYENKRPEVEKAEQALNQQMDTFAFLLGLPVGTKIALDGQIQPVFVEVDADKIVEEYLSANLTIRNTQQSLKTLKIQKSALDLSAYTPSLQIAWNTQPALSNALETNWLEKDNWYDNGSLSFTIAWNLTDMLPFSSGRQQAKELQTTIAKLELQLKTLEQNTELEIRTAVDNLNQSKKAIESSQRNIDLAQRSYNMTAIAYRNGTTELLDLRDAESSLNQAKLGLASEQYNYISNLLDLEFKVNTRLEETK